MKILYKIKLHTVGKLYLNRPFHHGSHVWVAKEPIFQMICYGESTFNLL